jgi:nucleoside-diphosphate-sugar epimerase
MKVVVTGGSGKAGRYVTADLREQGHQVLNVDRVPEGNTDGLYVLADLTDFGQARELIDGAEAVVHLAAIPAPGIRSEAETFRVNTLSTYNVFAAAVAAGAHRVVWASSETVLGLPFDTPPAFAPIDESIDPRPESSYALSKLAGELMAEQFARRSGAVFVGLRFSNIMSQPITKRFRSSGTNLYCASGICGAMSTPATWPKPFAAASLPIWRRRRCASLLPPTQ